MCNNCEGRGRVRLAISFILKIISPFDTFDSALNCATWWSLVHQFQDIKTKQMPVQYILEYDSTWTASAARSGSLIGTLNHQKLPCYRYTLCHCWQPSSRGSRLA
jgi:hypothetical protein